MGLLILAVWGAVAALVPKIIEAEAEHLKSKKWPPENRRATFGAGLVDYAVELVAAMLEGGFAAAAVAKVGVVLTVSGVKVGGPNVAAAIVAGLAAPSVIRLLGAAGPKGGGRSGR